MTNPTLFRATAYRLQRLDTPDHLQQPEVLVFIEASDPIAAAVRLQQVLATLWHCSAADVEFYNLASQAQLLGPGGHGTAEMGDAALLVTGWFHGPLFARADRTLLLVSPLVLGRLHRARQLALPWARHQREAALLAAGTPRHTAAARAQQLRDSLAADGLLHTDGAASLQS